ncbi:MAG: hypothetical protein JWR54_971, partial [Mucilaginibacter sp.]|nr:hypothetical protein [Mucilaginibacter sp.]
MVNSLDLVRRINKFRDRFVAFNQEKTVFAAKLFML